MTDVVLNVPYVSQKNIGGHVPGGPIRDDPTGCWYAAVCMLGHYREVGPRLGVPSQYLKPDGTPQKLDKRGNVAALPMGASYAQLMQNEGLRSVPLPRDKRWTCERLAAILRIHGPCYVRRGFVSPGGKLQGGHAIVLVGARTSRNEVLCHDPARGPNQICSIDEFNTFFKWDDARAKDFSMMWKPEVATAPGSSPPISATRKFFGG